MIGENSAMKFGLKPLQYDELPPSNMVGGKHTNALYLKGKESEAVEKYTEALAEYFQKNHVAQWEFVLQIASDVHSCDLEDGTARWNEEKCPYQSVGTFTIPRQLLKEKNASLYPYRDALQFNAWNQLEAHRPLGALQHARKAVYDIHGQTRREMNEIRVVDMKDLMK